MSMAPASSPRRTPRSPLTPEQRTLCEKYIPMAKSLAKPLANAWPPHAEEFGAAALLALVEAAQSFDPSRNVKFATFARYRIWGALRDVQRGLVIEGYRHNPGEMPVVGSLSDSAEEFGTVVGRRPEPSVEEGLEMSDWMSWLFRVLPLKNREVCTLIYAYGKSQSETADAMQLSKSRVSYLHSEALDFLRYYLEDKAEPDRVTRDKTIEVARHGCRKNSQTIAQSL